MKVTSKLRIGSGEFTFEVEEDNDMLAMVTAITLATPREDCNVCGAMGLETKRLIAYKTKEDYLYVKVRCEACDAESNLGQFKSGGFFWKEYAVWQASDYSEGHGPASGTTKAPETPDEQADDTAISPAGLSALNEKLGILEWSPKEVKGWLQEHFAVDRMQDLTLSQSREAYRLIEAEVKSAVPF